MQRFLDSNPGLRSRFNKHLVFADYTPEELRRILVKMVDDNGYRIDEAAIFAVGGIVRQHYEARDSTFGNARLIRNLVERAITVHATRVFSLPNLTRDDLELITEDDIVGPVS